MITSRDLNEDTLNKWFRNTFNVVGTLNGSRFGIYDTVTCMLFGTDVAALVEDFKRELQVSFRKEDQILVRVPIEFVILEDGYMLRTRVCSTKVRPSKALKVEGASVQRV